MDILAITETSENDNNSFLTNVNIDGFKPPFHTPTLSAKGGTALYVNKDYDSFERLDLKSKMIILKVCGLKLKIKMVRISFVVVFIGILEIKWMIFYCIWKR